MLAFVGLDESQQVLSYFSSRFGISPETFQGYHFLKIGSTIWVASAVPGLKEAIGALKVETVGIPLIRTNVGWWKPTTAGLQVFGKKATRNVVELDDEQLEMLLRKEPIWGQLPAEPGYVIVRWRGHILGCGLYGKGRLRSQIPFPYTISSRRSCPTSSEE